MKDRLLHLDNVRWQRVSQVTSLSNLMCMYVYMSLVTQANTVLALLYSRATVAATITTTATTSIARL